MQGLDLGFCSTSPICTFSTSRGMFGLQMEGTYFPFLVMLAHDICLCSSLHFSATKIQRFVVKRYSPFSERIKKEWTSNTLLSLHNFNSPKLWNGRIFFSQIPTVLISKCFFFNITKHLKSRICSVLCNAAHSWKNSRCTIIWVANDHDNFHLCYIQLQFRDVKIPIYVHTYSHTSLRNHFLFQELFKPVGQVCYASFWNSVAKTLITRWWLCHTSIWK